MSDGSHQRDPRSQGLLVCACMLAALAFAFAALASTTSNARSRPKCAGRPATQVSDKAHIVAKPHAVLVARGKRDHEITVAKNDKTDHIICSGAGDDDITAGRGDDILVGGPGNDTIKGGPGRNLIVGDNYKRKGDAIRGGGRDKLIGGRGRDVIIGDNLASSDARGGKPDNVPSKAGSDTLIGDSAVIACGGTARGGANDKLYGDQGDDLVIGDSFSRCGTANGGGNDVLSNGLGSTLMIGSSATLTGTAVGGGNDTLHGCSGGDFRQPCDGADSSLYGDSYALTTKGTNRGTGNDLLTAGVGDRTYLDGMGSNPGGGGRGRTICAGNKTGHNVAVRCAVYRDIQKILKQPRPPPPQSQLERFGAKWPFRSGSPEP